VFAEHVVRGPMVIGDFATDPRYVPPNLFETRLVCAEVG
jgi:hypothetical protein